MIMQDVFDRDLVVNNALPSWINIKRGRLPRHLEGSASELCFASVSDLSKATVAHRRRNTLNRSYMLFDAVGDRSPVNKLHVMFWLHNFVELSCVLAYATLPVEGALSLEVQYLWKVKLSGMSISAATRNIKWTNI